MYPFQRFPSGLLVDRYHIDSAYVSWKSSQNPVVTFDLYTRTIPFGGGYLVAAGQELVREFVRSFQFQPEDLAYLRSIQGYDEAFLRELEEGPRSLSVWAVAEGEIAFAHEPLVRVSGPFRQVLVLESGLLHLTGVSTLIATKASRIARAAGDTPVAEFGFRRAQAPYLAARSAYIGGCPTTSFLAAGEEFDIPTSGTIPHALVELYPSEEDAFRAVAAALPEYSLLLDTYDVQTAIECAIRVALDERVRSGHELCSVRLDSGDLVADARSVRRKLDDAGLTNVQILVSGDLDEWSIANLRRSGAPIDGYGVGAALATGAGSPEHRVSGGALGAVYKLVWVEDAPPPIKLAGDKSTWPGKKQVVRHGEFERDVIQLFDEPVHDGAAPLLHRIGEIGDSRLESRARLEEARRHTANQIHSLPDRFKTLDHPDAYPVEWSSQLIAMRDAAVATRDLS